MKIAHTYKHTPQFKALYKQAKEMFENQTYTQARFIHLIHQLEDDLLESTIDMEVFENNII